MDSEHIAFGFEAGLSAQAQARLGEQTNTVKTALEKAIRCELGRGKLASGLTAKVASDLLWSMAEGTMQVATTHPKHKPVLVDALVSAMRAVLH